ncbi:MAG: VOC family protein [Eubacteriales bacterium]|nr:VOC family protein [Eubacteriales bacterium]
MSLVKGINHIGIIATDYDKSFHFYTQVLGLTPTISFRKDDRGFAMLDMGNNNAIELFCGGTVKDVQNMFKHLALEVEDSKKVYEACVAAGCESVEEPHDINMGGKDIRISFVKGPDGEILEFYQAL